MTAPNTTISVTLTGGDWPETFDWRGRKITITPNHIILTYRSGEAVPISAMATGPSRPAPGKTLLSFNGGEMTITFYSQWPEHWPQWLRDLGAANAPR